MDPVLQGIFIICALAGMMWVMLKFMLRDIHKDLNDLKEGQKRIELRMDKAEARSDHLYEETNKLYGVCINLLQTRR